MKFKYGWYSCPGDEAWPEGDEDNDYVWCLKTFGEDNPNGEWFFDHDRNIFYFKKEKDAVWYELRWCNRKIGSSEAA